MIRKFGLALTAAVLFGGLGAGAAMAANPELPNVLNGSFDTVNGAAPKNYFTNVQPADWTFSGGGGNLVFVDNASDPNATAAGPVYLTTYANPNGSGITGNYVEADGNPDYESVISQTLTGLTPGQTYTLGFYQAASEQLGFNGGIPTTDRWIVSLGTAGLQINYSVHGFSPTYGQTDTYFNPDSGASIAQSDLMTVPVGTATTWDFVTVDLTADASTQVLSFLAWGDQGSDVNLPPIAFLTGISSPSGMAATPEPAVWIMLCVGVMSVGGMLRNRRRRTAVAATA